MKDRRLTPKQIERLLANNPNKIEINPNKTEIQEDKNQNISFKGTDKEYDTLRSTEQLKAFCAFIRDVISRYEENQRQQEEAETMEMDLKHCIELAQRLTEKEKKTLYNKFTEVLQLRRACKSENEILQPLYNYFSDRVLLNKIQQLQGTISNIKEIVSNRTYSCRTSVLDDFRIDSSV